MDVRVVLTVTLVVVSGCNAVPGLPTSGPGEVSTPAPSPSVEPQSTPSATATPTSTPVPRNPWHADPVVIGINRSADPDRDYAVLVQAAIDYWNGNVSFYSDFEVVFRLEPTATNTDIELRFVESIPRCSGYDPSHTLGCSPFYTRPGQANGTSVIEIRTDLTEDSTVFTIKHELGHVLGISHNESPMPLMAPIHGDATLLPVTNATDRPLPYRTRNLSVHVDSGTGISRETADREVTPALEYYERGADGWLTVTPRFVRSNESTAEIIVKLTTEPGCGYEDGGVCVQSIQGEQLDSDGAYEYYSRTTIVVAGVDPDHMDWFIGYGLGFALGASNQTDLPPPLLDQANKYEKWWE